MSETLHKVNSHIEAARLLAKGIAESAKFKEFEKMRDRLRADPEAQEMLKSLEMAEQKAQRAATWGGLSKNESKNLETLREETFKHPRILAFLNAQNGLVAELQELNQYMTEKLGIDFADMTKPQTGCCG